LYNAIFRRDLIAGTVIAYDMMGVGSEPVLIAEGK